MGKNTYTLARLEWDRLIVTGSLLERRRTRDRSSYESVEFLVRFVFSQKNAQLLSWGTKDVTIDGKTITLPAATRKKKEEVLFRDYWTLCKDVGRN